MKKIFLAIVLIAAVTVGANAQKGTKQISAGVELGLPAGAFGDAAKVGFGVNGKAIFGITDNGAITATTGFSNFGYKYYSSSNVSIIPILGGYRHDFGGSVKGLYAEPQIGAGIYMSKFGTGSYKSKDSEVNFTWALGGGYVYDNFDFGLRYQRAQGEGGGAGFFALKVAYNFPLAGK
ncbi:porin family protein [Ilyomonas limi]|uniref:Porin family protein n=1 Tax=Ilyomonas limi TaxID=2575867 RepID=A0A4U3KYA3_9BACT|nr:porin family protein [Ilyomonas limi]TKK67691.1 porin family protein [Ilyomonas limi]